MTTRAGRWLLAGATVGCLVACGPAAAQGGLTVQQAQGQEAPSSMMARCRQNCERMSTEMSRLSALAGEAERSGDPDRMRAALAEVGNAIAGMNQDMASCREMMRMMEQMGGMPGMGGGMMPGTGGGGMRPGRR